jgi:MFS family permease
MAIGANYLSFILSNRRFLGFGLLLTFASSFGQTYFISLFSADIRARFGLSHGDFGAIYALGTLASAASLIWVGRKIDHIDLRLFCLFVTVGLGIACILMAWSPSVVVLGFAIYTLRLFGQGLMSHASSTAMARYFESSRGTALSIASIGYPLGEALFPFAAVSLLAVLSTGQTWGVIALSVFLIIAPLVQFLLRGHQERHQRHLERARELPAHDPQARQFSRIDVLKDRNCYVILSVVLAPSYITTGIFFHQVHLVDVKGWELSWFAAAFVVYATCQLISSLATGPLIDRSNALRLLPWFLMPLGVGLTILSAVNHPLAIPLFMLFGGLSAGASATISGALWAEIYGVAHLGAIKAMAVALMVFSTALSPASLGWMIDAAVSLESILYAMAAYIALSSAFAGLWFRRGVR